MLFPIFVPKGKSRTQFTTGYIDAGGHVVIPAEFLHGTLFHEGLASVQVKGGRWGVINERGEFQIEPRLWNWCEFHDDIAALATSKGKWGLIDAQGNALVEPRYDHLGPLQFGLAAMRVGASDGARWGYVDKNGNEVISASFRNARGFSEGLAAVRLGQLWGYIDTTGLFKIKPRFDASGRARRYPDIRAGRFVNGLAPVWLGNDRYGFIDTNGEEAFDERFDEANSFSEGRAVVGNGSHFGFIDETGQLQVPYRFTLARDFNEGLAQVEVNGPRAGHPSRCGFIDPSGDVAIDPVYWSAESFRGGLSLVATDDHLAWIHRSGNVIWQGKYVDYGVLF